MGGWSNKRMGDPAGGRSNMSHGASRSGGAGPLDPATAALVRLAAAVAAGAVAELALHPALEDLVLVDAYGKVIGRPGLDLKRRELATVAAIAVLGTAQQLHSHLRGALNTGASAEEVEAVLELVAGDLSPAYLRRAQ